MAILQDNSTRSGSPRTNTTSRAKAMKRIMSSYRRKITRVFPSAKFDDVFVLGCDADAFASYLESHFTPQMTWDNYPSVWWVTNGEKFSKSIASKPDEFYRYFNHKSFLPRLVEEVGGRIANLSAGARPKPEGFTLADGTPFLKP